MRKIFRTVLALSVASLAVIVTGLAAGQPDKDGQQGDAESVARTAAITPQEIHRHIRYLASDALKGRFTGSDEAKLAAEYLAAEFRQYGLKPVGDNGSYFQSFPFVAGINLGKDNSLTVMINGRARMARVKEDFAPMAFSTEELVESEVVFIGYGISAADEGYDDYAGLDVKDKLVLALRFSPDGDNPHSKFERHASFRAKALMARQHGARAIAFIADTDDFKTSKLSQLEFDYSFSDSGIVAVSISRQLAREMLTAAGAPLDELQKKIDEKKAPDSRPLPGVSAKLRVDLVKDTRPAVNVVGFLEGTDPRLKDEIIVIGAHYDHLGLGGTSSLAPSQIGEVHNGADDNASGTAGVLELAQAFAARRSELKRSLLFMAFSGEEEGLLGSSHYVKNPMLPLERTVAMINMDMIGRLTENRLTVQGLGTSPQWQSLVEEINRTAKFDLRTTAGGTGPSDHSSFYLKDIPVLFFFTGVHTDYHKPSDDAERIDAEGEARVVAFVSEVVARIQDQPERLQFTKAPSAEQPTRGFRVSLGTIPEYGVEVEGLQLSGVREGSPAERAGLKGGDIIVRVGPTRIKNIYDYTFVLGELKPGEEVEVEVLRDGQSVVFKLVPEGRR